MDNLTRKMWFYRTRDWWSRLFAFRSTIFVNNSDGVTKDKMTLLYRMGNRQLVVQTFYMDTRLTRDFGTGLKGFCECECKGSECQPHDTYGRPINLDDINQIDRRQKADELELQG